MSAPRIDLAPRQDHHEPAPLRPAKLDFNGATMRRERLGPADYRRINDAPSSCSRRCYVGGCRTGASGAPNGWR